MRLQDSPKMNVAYQVLKRINPAKKRDNRRIEAYCNGREQGFRVVDCKRSVCFSEYRNSDQIVVYSGGTYDFDMAGNIPNEKVYANKRFFSPEDYDAVATFINLYLDGKG